MTTADRISQQVSQLPESFQKEVLDFIEFLINKLSGRIQDKRI